MTATRLMRRMGRGLVALRPVRPVKIFGIGLPKTGTKTLGCCFRRFGFKHRSYDMNLAVQVRKHDFENAFAVAEKHETFEDWPWFLMYKELDQRFPGSKFVLTLRKDTETYVASVKKHHARQGVKNKDFVRPFWWDDVFGCEPDQWDYQKGFLSAESYERHNREVLEYFKDRPNDLLVVCWENGDGWDKLCSFLDRTCPAEPFPHRHKSRSV
jgi:hypothetical protein